MIIKFFNPLKDLTIQNPSCVSISNDSKFIIVGANNPYEIHIFDIKKLKKLNSLKGHNSYIYEAKFSKDDKLIASVSADKTLIIWDFK